MNDEEVIGREGARLANVLFDKCVAVIGGFPASTPAQRAAIAEWVSDDLRRWAKSERDA